MKLKEKRKEYWITKYRETRCVCETQMLPIIDGQNQKDRYLDILIVTSNAHMQYESSNVYHIEVDQCQCKSKGSNVRVKGFRINKIIYLKYKL